MSPRISSVLKAVGCGLAAGLPAGLAALGIVSRALYYRNALLGNSMLLFRWLIVLIFPVIGVGLAAVADLMAFIDDQYVLAGVGGGAGLVTVVVLAVLFGAPLFHAGMAGFVAGLITGAITGVLHRFLFSSGPD